MNIDNGRIVVYYEAWMHWHVIFSKTRRRTCWLRLKSNIKRSDYATLPCILVSSIYLMVGVGEFWPIILWWSLKIHQGWVGDLFNKRRGVVMLVTALTFIYNLFDKFRYVYVNTCRIDKCYARNICMKWAFKWNNNTVNHSKRLFYTIRMAWVIFVYCHLIQNLRMLERECIYNSVW